MSMKHCLDMMYILQDFPVQPVHRFLVGARSLRCFVSGGSFVF